MPELYPNLMPLLVFPAATNLDDKQLITLHIHEALHRSLPDDIREDEKIVGEIAQAITSPEASKDQIKQIVSKYLQEPTANPTETNISNRMIMPHKDSRLHYPSKIRLGYRHFNNVKDNDEFQQDQVSSFISYQVTSIHLAKGRHALEQDLISHL